MILILGFGLLEIPPETASQLHPGISNTNGGCNFHRFDILVCSTMSKPSVAIIQVEAMHINSILATRFPRTLGDSFIAGEQFPCRHCAIPFGCFGVPWRLFWPISFVLQSTRNITATSVTAKSASDLYSVDNRQIVALGYNCKCRL